MLRSQLLQGINLETQGDRPVRSHFPVLFLMFVSPPDFTAAHENLSTDLELSAGLAKDGLVDF